MIEPDEIPDVDLGVPLDITGDDAVDKWRGVAAEEVDEPSAGLAGLLRSRSRKLLGSLVRPHTRSLLLAAVFIGFNTAAQLSVPLLVAYGIDHGIPPLEKGGSGSLVPLLSAVLAIVGISVVLVVLNWKLALPVLLALPILLLMTRWFRNQSERAYRETRDAVALVIVHFVESLGGIQAVHAFRREPRNQEIFEHLNDRYRRANVWSQRLAAAYGPGVQLVGRMTTAVVVFYGGWLAIDGQVSVGVLAAFLLYLRRFFEPMQELSQFYNLFQAAVAGLEKLSGVVEEPLSVAPPSSPVVLPHPPGRVRFDAVDFPYR